MTVWLVFAALTVAALGVIFAPLLVRSGGSGARAQFDLSVYRDQLAELDRDEKAGLISATDAKAARNEISRRMLAAGSAGDEAKPAGGAGRMAIVAAGAVAIPAVAFGVYAWRGNPAMPDLPRAERIANAAKNNDFPALIAKVEDYLRKNPKDTKGWLVLAPAYRRLGRYGDAANAYGRALDLMSPTPDLLTNFGEMQVLANKGKVTGPALAAFKKAVRLDAKHAKARFYLALAQSQAGDKAGALASLKAMLADAPANAPWRPAVERQVAALERVVSQSGTAPGPSQDDVKAAASLTPQQRQAMIRSMVQRLADRLKEDGGDLDGWLRLANARMVLGERDAAAAALAGAMKNFATDEAARKRIAAAAKRLGLPSPN